MKLEAKFSLCLPVYKKSYKCRQQTTVKKTPS